MAFDMTGLAAFLSSMPAGYQRGQENAARLKAQELQNQDAMDVRNASIASILDQGGTDPVSSTIAALSGNQPPPQGPTPGGTPQPPTGAPPPNAGAPPPGAVPPSGPGPAGQMGAPGANVPINAGAPMPPQNGGVTAPMRPAGTPPAPSFGGGQMSLGQMLIRMKQDPRNKGIPDATLLGLAGKYQSILNPQDRLLLQYLLSQQSNNIAQRGQDLAHQDRQSTLAATKENREATAALRMDLARMGMDKAQAAKWQILQDQGAGGKNFRYNAETGQATELDGKTPYTPSGTGASKIGSGTEPRSAPAMALKKFMQEHPEATADQVAAFGAEYGQRVKAARDFGTGPLGNSIRSINTAVQHLDTVLEAGKALASGDSRLINTAKQAYQKAFGSELPTNFDAMMQIVGPEIVKSIVAGGGGVSEREEAKQILSRVSSPAQLEGAITSLQALMAGQLNSLRKQYETTTKLDDFDKRFLTEHTLSAMTRGGYQSQSSSGQGGGGSAPSTQQPTVSNW